ncbi:helix-turn-helix transcriptional regulator [Actinomadura fulvescens]|uniref:HTH cro/C1-type domain-containing protein n=1 Tax=Actinomadura fulvescens TaxID=46160 RepID=A0ABP6CMR2_9ACTN
MSSPAKRRRRGAVQRLTFGQWLSDRMAQCGYDSDVALAKRTEIRDSTIGRWRADKAQPSIDQLRKIADALKVGVPELLVRSGHATTDELGLDEEMFEQPLDPGLAMIGESRLGEAFKEHLRTAWTERMRQERDRLASQIDVLERADVIWHGRDGEGRALIIQLVSTSLHEAGFDLPESLLHDLGKAHPAFDGAATSEEVAAPDASDQDKSNIHSIK